MTSENPGTGGCLCGAVRYQMTKVPTALGACHCSMCRKFSGGIELSVQVEPGTITWLSDDTLATFQSSEWAERGFCSVCGSSLFWKLTAEGPMQGMFALSAGSLDTLDGLTFDIEVYIDSKPDCYAFTGERKRMTEADVMEMVAAAGGDTPA